MTEELDDLVKDAIEPDGGLFCLGWYLSWTPGEPTACLDDRFTAKQLRDIANWMDAHQPATSRPPAIEPQT